MTAVETPSDQRQSPFEWTVRAAWLLALLVTAFQLVGVVVAIGNAIAPLTANPLSVSIQTSEPLRPVGQNSYGGTPYVADTATITATRVTAEVSNIATPTRVGLAFGPIAWMLTGAGVACCLTLAFGRLVRTRAHLRKAAAALVAAGIITAVGTYAGQILDEFARTGLQGTMWHGSTGMNQLGAGGDFTFQLGWLAIALGAVAIAAVIARQDSFNTSDTP
jgi:hypothetical protein